MQTRTVFPITPYCFYLFLSVLAILHSQCPLTDFQTSYDALPRKDVLFQSLKTNIYYFNPLFADKSPSYYFDDQFDGTGSLPPKSLYSGEVQ